jgi:hypothetical protein
VTLETANVFACLAVFGAAFGLLYYKWKSSLRFSTTDGSLIGFREAKSVFFPMFGG